MIFAEVPNHLSMCFKQLTFHLILNHITTHHLPCINLVYELRSNERVELLKAINRWISTSARTNSSDDAKKSTMSHTVLVHSKQHLHNKRRRPNRKHRCGVHQIPSEGQVRTSHNSRAPERGKLCLPWLVRVLGLL